MIFSKKKSKAQDHRISSLESDMANFKTNQANMNASIKNLENQKGQLAHSMKESSSRSFPSDTKNNTKECMAITLRSEKEIGDSKEVENEKIENEKEKVKVGQKEKKKEKDKFTSRRILFPDNPPLIVPPFPFPLRFKRAKLDAQFAKF